MRFTILVSALAVTASALPAAEKRQNNDVCFRVQARCPYGSEINGRWLEGPKIGDIKFDKDYKDSGLFILDSQKQLRNAYTGSYATRDQKSKKDYGETEMIQPRKDTKNDRMTCERQDGLLKCWTRQGDSTYQKSKRLIVGQNVDRGIYPVELVVVEDKCPSRVWESWN